MADITIGVLGNLDGYQTTGDRSVWSPHTPANADGVIDTITIRGAVNTTTLRVGTVTPISATSAKRRDFATIGTCDSGADRTFTGLAITCKTNDCIAYHDDTGMRCGRTTAAGENYMHTGTGTNIFSNDDEISFITLSNYNLRLIAEGETVSAGSLSLKNVFGRPFRGCFR